MSIKNKAMHQGMKLMSDPRVMKLMQDERFMKAMMAAMSVPGRVSTAAQEQSDRFAKVMALATEQEVRDLRRTVRSLEEQLTELQKEVARLRADDHR
ncbi:MAG: hypothetical protein CSA75_04945 [Sorangium cellulosum]|nr:MAG: hypothetical protein CSA75_04945 [Sorangium cellulosum]